MTDPSYPIVVVGGGYAGLRAVQRLAGRLKNPSRILLIDRSADHQIVTQLHRVAAWSRRPDLLRFSFEELIGGSSFLQATVTHVDLEAHQITTEHGVTGYRMLVLAPGAEVVKNAIPGLNTFALTLRWLEDAVKVRERVGSLAALESTMENPADTTIVIGGGGATGVQLAAELADWLRLGENAPRFGRIVLVELERRLLPRMSGGIATEVEKALREKRVDVLLERRITAIDAEAVYLDDQEAVPARTIIWAGGVEPPAPIKNLNVLKNDQAIVPDSYLRVPGHVDAFVGGDSAAILDGRSGRPFPPSAQLAIQSGEAIAVNVLRTFAGQPLLPFRPRLSGETIAVGRNAAVARVGRVVLTGFPALTAKRYAEERYIDQIGGVELLQEWQAGIGSNSL